MCAEGTVDMNMPLSMYTSPASQGEGATDSSACFADFTSVMKSLGLKALIAQSWSPP